VTHEIGAQLTGLQIEKAKSNGVKHAFVADAQSLEMPEDDPEVLKKFDAVFSNATLHWCKRDPLGVLTSVRKVLKPGGRPVVEMGGFMNAIGMPDPFGVSLLTPAIKGIRLALHDVVRSKGYDPEEFDPWFFPSMEEYVKVTYLILFPRPNLIRL
jgi:SAM-dependent methyltransferase